MERRDFLKTIAAGAITVASPSCKKSEESIQTDENFVSKKIRKQRPELSLDPSIKIPETPDGVNILGKINQWGANTREAQILLSLRYKNITDTVEKKYNLPPGIILAMIIQESHGADLVHNSSNDGRIGLSHMQPSTSTSFGLNCYQGNTKLIDKVHGRKLKELIQQCKQRQPNTNDPRADIALAQKDDRFNPVLNIDAVGRMLACHLHDAKPRENEGPLRYALRRYSGRPFEGKGGYGHHIFNNMGYLYDREWIEELEKKFNKANKRKTINGSPLTFENYLQEHQKYNHAFGLSELSKTTCTPKNSEKARETFHSFVKKGKESHATRHEASYFEDHYNFDEKDSFNLKNIGIGAAVAIVLFRKKIRKILKRK